MGATTDERREEHRIAVASKVVGLLNEVERLCTGWVLEFERDEVSKILDPLYTKLDEV